MRRMKRESLLPPKAGRASYLVYPVKLQAAMELLKSAGEALQLRSGVLDPVGSSARGPRFLHSPHQGACVIDGFLRLASSIAT